METNIASIASVEPIRKLLDLPGITSQAAYNGWRAGFYDFRKAKNIWTSYFNPGLVEHEGKRWLITRRSRNNISQFQYGYNDLMAFLLENNEPQYGVELQVDRMRPQEHFEDPRAMVWNGHVWLSACTFVVFEANRWSGAHQAIMELRGNWLSAKRYDPPFGGNRPGSIFQTRNEKNWLWFLHGGAPHMVYLTQPHTVLRFDDRFNPVQKWETKHWIPEWQWGEPRGGTPPVLVDGQYWTFFHSSLPWRDKYRRYVMGAYSFEAQPPFRVTSVTEFPLLSGSQRDPWAPGKPLVVFPCGAIFEDGRWLITLGVNDLASAWLELPHHAVLSRCRKAVDISSPLG